MISNAASEPVIVIVGCSPSETLTYALFIRHSVSSISIVVPSVCMSNLPSPLVATAYPT